ncbi:FxSxx-COOH cyclophane-containing RiPP peptide [Frankia sp. AgB32]|uniref:FxSxx-COOH cyclophane-containing RiPP peptide n=1 Tax=Frankia sp. AgB32 TaxID=631119 RepID=UPI0034D44048
MFESVLPDLSGVSLTQLGEDSNPHLERILARLRREAETPGASHAGFNSSVGPDRDR